MKSLLIPQLLWKDYRVIRPLVLFIWGLAILLNLTQPDEYENKFPRSLAAMELWILIPHLFASLAPLILVGTERENGTNRWLQQFPLSWQRIAASERCTAAIALLSVWIFSTVCFAPMYIIEGYFIKGLFSPGGINLPFGQSPISLLHLGFSSLAWLMISFVLVQLIRSSVIASVPIVLIGFTITTLTHYAARDRMLSKEIIGIGEPLYVAWVFVAIIVSGPLSMFIARAQINRKLDSQFLGNFLHRQKISSPQTVQRLKQTRPSIWGALLWQQYRQLRLPAALWIGITLCATFLSWMRQFTASENFPSSDAILPIISFLGVLSIGVLTFYQGSKRGEKAFLANRGMNPSTVWWTRVIPALIASLPIQIILVIDLSFPSLITGQIEKTSIEPFVALTYVMVIFVSGILTSQSIERPVFAFLVTPCVLFFILAMPAVWAPQTGTSPIPITAILLFGSWKLTRRWMDGQVNFRFAVSVVGYITLATLPWPIIYYVT